MTKAVQQLRSFLLEARSVLIYLWRTPGVWRTRHNLRKSGFVVRMTGGRLHCLYRIGESDPFHKCNRYGVPVAEGLIGSKAMQQVFQRNQPDPHDTLDECIVRKTIP